MLQLLVRLEPEPARQEELEPQAAQKELEVPLLLLMEVLQLLELVVLFQLAHLGFALVLHEELDEKLLKEMLLQEAVYEMDLFRLMHLFLSPLVELAYALVEQRRGLVGQRMEELRQGEFVLEVLEVALLVEGYSRVAIVVHTQ